MPDTPPTTALDHVIIGVPDLEAAIAEAGAAGFACVAGGSHATRVTANALIPFDNGYLELLTITDVGAARTEPVLAPLIELCGSRRGFVGAALEVDDPDTVLCRAAARGTPLHGPVLGERQLPGGPTITWNMLLPSLDIFASGQPFLIHWGSDRHLRFGSDAPTGHPNGANALRGVTLRAPHPEHLAATWADLLGVLLTAGDEAIRVRTTDGSQYIDLLPPNSTQPITGDALVVGCELTWPGPTRVIDLLGATVTLSAGAA